MDTQHLPKTYWIGPVFFQTILRPLVYFLMRVFCRLEVKGLNNLEQVDGRSLILVSNHIHELDGFLLPAAIPLSSHLPPIYPVSREREFYREKKIGSYIYGGRFFRFMGAFPAIGKLNDYAKSLKFQFELLDNGETILVFPEGRVQRTLDPNNVKGGVGYLFFHSRKLVLPVKMSGLEGCTLWKFITRQCKLTVTIGNAIDPEEFFDDGEIEVSRFKQYASDLVKRVASL